MSKLAVVQPVRRLVEDEADTPVLCIGDRGRWPGNDFVLLGGQFGLSVYEASPDPHHCWNLCPPGQRGRQATLASIVLPPASRRAGSGELPDGIAARCTTDIPAANSLPPPAQTGCMRLTHRRQFQRGDFAACRRQPADFAYKERGMNGKRITQGLLSSLILTAALLADEPTATTPPPKVNQPLTESKSTDRAIRLHLMEGSVVSGKLSIDSIHVETPFGTLDIPVANVITLTPGLDSHPEERKRIGRLIQQLGSNVAAERDAAQRTLTEMGAAIQSELVAHLNDGDMERHVSLQKILAELEEANSDDDTDTLTSRPWVAQDTVETNLFTVVGRVSPQAFSVQTQFGPLNVSISDIRRGEREPDLKPEIRKSLIVSGQNLVQLNMLNSGIRVNRGDKISVTADGKLTMTPWGNNAFATPDGSEQFQWYIPNQIAGGALVARIANGGKIFKIGSKQSFSAASSGMLQFGIAMNPQFASPDYAFPGEYNVKVKVNQK
ncbi:MAG: hypothetical protein EXS05_10165 [Planctomycetaceae bacterium]|nr:hypothetical protein [Planctomycetaceae bacterium]